MQLDPTAMAAGVRLIAHDTLDSTNAEALRKARDCECGPLWIVAKSQTAGRGRRGRTWVSEPGNLYASLILTDPAPPERFPDLSFVAALGTAIIGRIVQWNRGEGFAAIRADWLKRAFGLGKSVRVALAEGECEGHFETIDETGRMVLRRADGAAEIITAGDVLPALAKA